MSGESSGRARFSNTELGDIAEQLTPIIGAQPPTRVEFERLEDRVDNLIEVGADVARLEERVNNEQTRATENERRLAESLEQVARSVRDVDRRTTNSIDSLRTSTSEAIGVLSESSAEAHSRIDNWRNRFLGATAVIGVIWIVSIWVYEHIITKKP